MRTLHLFMPTMELNRGDDEDSDYEEEVRIAQKEIICILNSRRVVQNTDLEINMSPPSPMTIQLLCIEDSEFLGIKVTQFDMMKLQEQGYFIFINDKVWQISDLEIEQFGLKKLQNRRSKKERLINHYWIS